MASTYEGGGRFGSDRPMTGNEHNPRRNPREGWEADAQRVAALGDDAPVWPELPNDDDAALDW